MKTSIKLYFTAFATLFAILFAITTGHATPLNGTYTIGSGGDYPTIQSAAADVSVQGISGNVIFNIKSGVYSEHITLNSFSVLTPGLTITFKSLTGNSKDVIIQNLVDDIENILINEADNFILRDLTFSMIRRSKIRFVGQCSNIKILNNFFTTGSDKNLNAGEPSAHVLLTNVLIADNFFEGVSLSGVSIFTSTGLSSGIKVINNHFECILNSAGGILIQGCNNVLIEKNYITNELSRVGIYMNNCQQFTISKNILYKSSLSINLCGTTTAQSIISNNFIIDFGNSNITICKNILLIYNTIKINEFAPIINCIGIRSSVDITSLNNLFIYYGSSHVAFITSSTMISDYNNYFTTAKNDFIYYNGVDYPNLRDFYDETGLDLHSNSRNVNFVSLSDLHLAGSSIGDIELAGVPSTIITDDIDGNPRSTSIPYKGADEAVDFPLPVELSSFNSTVINNLVQLKWTTSSEINNSGFDIERSTINNQTSNDWQKIGFVQGSGNSNTTQYYDYDDRNLSSGKYKYRLKQTDFNGSFEYFNLNGDVNVATPLKFELSQNYPNPFNPFTKINYNIPVDGKVNLSVFDISGKEVKTLVNEVQTAGYYTINFNASEFSSGVYSYRIIAESNGNKNMITKKMVLIK